MNSSKSTSKRIFDGTAVARAIDAGRRADDEPLARFGVARFGGSQKTTTTTQPWSVQQPYLEQGLGSAQNLFENYTPQYYPGQQVAGFSPSQIAGLTGIETQALNGEPITDATMNFGTGLESGNYLNANPALSYFANLAGSNLGLSNPGSSALEALIGGSAPGMSQLSGIASTNPANGQASSLLSDLAGTNFGLSNPGTAALESYANGSQSGANNPALQNTENSIMSTVLPQVESQFIGENNWNNPAAAYAAANGVTSALAPTVLSANQQAQQNQIGAATTLGQNTLQGSSLQGNLANILGQLGLSGTGLQSGAASSLLNEYLGGASGLEGGALGGGNLQATAAQGISSPFQQTLQSMVQGEALAPSTQGLPYADYARLLGAGGAEQGQAQNDINAAMNEFNYYQGLPYQQLNQYIGEATGVGSYPSSTTSTQQSSNPFAAILTGLQGLNSATGPGGMLSSGSGGLFSSGGLFGGSGALASLFGGGGDAAAYAAVLPFL